MTTAFVVYMTGWIAACLAAGYLMARNRRALELFGAGYRRFLLQDWKVLTFLVAATVLTVVAPYTDDPTWDYADALFMSLLTFATAPWAVGTLYRALRRRAPWVNAYVALCLWLFSASWSYDLYIVLRDGMVPPTWLPNLFLSSVLYLSAGLLWSLEWTRERGVVLQFTEAHWPARDAERNRAKVVAFGLPFMILAAAVIIPFLV